MWFRISFLIIILLGTMFSVRTIIDQLLVGTVELYTYNHVAKRPQLGKIRLASHVAKLALS